MSSTRGERGGGEVGRWEGRREEVRESEGGRGGGKQGSC